MCSADGARPLGLLLLRQSRQLFALAQIRVAEGEGGRGVSIWCGKAMKADQEGGLETCFSPQAGTFSSVGGMEGISGSVSRRGRGNRHVCCFGVSVRQVRAHTQKKKKNFPFYLVLSNTDVCDAKGKYYSVYLTFIMSVNCMHPKKNKKNNKKNTCNCPLFYF